MTSSTVSGHQSPASATPTSTNWALVTRRTLLYLILTILAILFVVPVYGVVVTAFKSVADVASGGYWKLPPHPNLENFRSVLDPILAIWVYICVIQSC